MVEVASTEFLKWASEGCIAPDPHYDDPRYLVYDGVSSDSRFWEMPEDERLEDFFCTFIEMIGRNGAIHLWPREPSWGLSEDDVNGMPSDSPIRIAIQSGVSGSLLIEAVDFPHLIAFLCHATKVGFCVYHDVFLVPVARDSTAFLDHHNVTCLVTKDPEILNRAIEFMASRGYALPDELPDSTFKPQHWIGDGLKP